MKKVLILVLIAVCFQVVAFVNRQLEAFNNTQVTVMEADRCQQSVENGMPVEFCDQYRGESPF